MAHGEKCIGTWLNSNLGGQDDGSIKIDDHSGPTITGLHLKSNKPIVGTCDGSVQSFSRVDDKGDTVNYKNGVITLSGAKFKIKGKFDRMPKSLKETAAKGQKKKILSDDWTAEKST